MTAPRLAVPEVDRVQADGGPSAVLHVAQRHHNVPVPLIRDEVVGRRDSGGELASVGSRGDSYDSALAAFNDPAVKAELVQPRERSWRGMATLERRQALAGGTGRLIV